jgi:transposase
MVAIPTLEEEDAKRPNRERENLIGERMRIVNRMRGCLARLGIRNFKSTLRKASELLATLCTPEGRRVLPNTLAELRRDMARLHFIMDQIREIEGTRLQRLKQSPEKGPHAMVRLLARVIGVGIETADMLVHEVLSRNLRDRASASWPVNASAAARMMKSGPSKFGLIAIARRVHSIVWSYCCNPK